MEAAEAEWSSAVVADGPTSGAGASWWEPSRQTNAVEAMKAMLASRGDRQVDAAAEDTVDHKEQHWGRRPQEEVGEDLDSKVALSTPEVVFQ